MNSNLIASCDDVLCSCSVVWSVSDEHSKHRCACMHWDLIRRHIKLEGEKSFKKQNSISTP